MDLNRLGPLVLVVGKEAIFDGGTLRLAPYLPAGAVVATGDPYVGPLGHRTHQGLEFLVAADVWREAVHSAQTASVVPASSARGPSLIRAAEVAKLLGVSRDQVEAWRTRTPPGLIGAPVKVGAGRSRDHWMWRADRVFDWLDDVRRFEAPQPAPKGPRRGRSRQSSGTSRSEGSLLAQVTKRGA